MTKHCEIDLPPFEMPAAAGPYERYQQIEAAWKNRGSIVGWCRSRAVTLEVSDRAHHWRFRWGKHEQMEWWPAIGKLVVNGKYKRPLLAENLQQVMTAIDPLLQATARA